MDDGALFGEVRDKPDISRKPIVRLPYFSDCVHWRKDDVDALQDMVMKGHPVTFATFRKHVDEDTLNTLCEMLGYTKGQKLQLWTDPYVSSNSGRLHGKPAYWFVWSAIEHVFWKE